MAALDGLVIGTVGSLAANIATAGPGLTSRVIAGWPALALLIAVKLLSGVLDHRAAASHTGVISFRQPGPAAALRAGPAWPRLQPWCHQTSTCQRRALQRPGRDLFPAPVLTLPPWSGLRALHGKACAEMTSGSPETPWPNACGKTATPSATHA